MHLTITAYFFDMVGFYQPQLFYVPQHGCKYQHLIYTSIFQSSAQTPANQLLLHHVKKTWVQLEISCNLELVEASKSY